MIRHIVDATHLTIKDFADKYHIPYTTLIKWIHGYRTPPEYVVELLWYRVCQDYDLDYTYSDLYII